MDDAGIQKDEIDSAVYSVYSDLLVRQGGPDSILHDYLGLNGRPAQRVTAGAASGVFAVKAGWTEIMAGLSDCVLVVGVQKALDVLDPGGNQRGDAALEVEISRLIPPGTFLSRSSRGR